MCCTQINRGATALLLLLSWVWLLLEVVIRVLLFTLPPDTMKSLSIVFAIFGAIFTLWGLLAHIALTLTVAKEESISNGHVFVAFYIAYVILAAIFNAAAITIFMMYVGIYGCLGFFVFAYQLFTLPYFMNYCHYLRSWERSTEDAEARTPTLS
ncbi:hypothetical protein QR680_007964 [Steinernema hermaphroditum]|uniref:Uncharacterized protein n=1 Tax=Steinernema hermaphroditum TaxID=289476 RepID=A0AA39IH08_9BILA|nr:hypothetical protein QR680_007964 [Steinernema hermaphroditum]